MHELMSEVRSWKRENERRLRELSTPSGRRRAGEPGATATAPSTAAAPKDTDAPARTPAPARRMGASSGHAGAASTALTTHADARAAATAAGRAALSAGAGEPQPQPQP